MNDAIYATIGAIGFEGRMDYGAIGTVTNLAARLCSEATGGQILISDQAHEAMDGPAPAGVSLRELGPFRLRGIARGHVLFQVEAPGLPTTFPPPREAGAVPATSAS